MSRKRKNTRSACFFNNESFQYRINEKKSKSSLSKLMYRLPFSLITSTSKYSKTFYGCEFPINKIINSKSLKNTAFIGFDYEKYCDGKTDKLIRKKIQVKKTKVIETDDNESRTKKCSVSLNKLSFEEILKMDISLGTKTYIYDLQDYCNSSHSSKYLSVSPKDSSDYLKDSNDKKEIEYICLSGSDDEENKNMNSRDHSFQLNNYSILSPLKSHNTFVTNNQNLALEKKSMTYNFRKNVYIFIYLICNSLKYTSKIHFLQSSNPKIFSECRTDNLTFRKNSIDNFNQSRIYDIFMEKEKQRQLESLNLQNDYSNPCNRLTRKMYRSNKNYLISEADVIDLT